jgi:hypothetical protein
MTSGSVTDLAVIARSDSDDPSTLAVRASPGSNPFFPRGAVDCFAEPVIGPRFARTRWLAMTIQSHPIPLQRDRLAGGNEPSTTLCA